MALRLHFKDERYNVFESRGAVRSSEQSYRARRDYYMFERLSRNFKTDKEVIQFFVANFAYGSSSLWNNLESEKNYLLWNKRKESITNTFKTDLETIVEYCESKGINIKEIYHSNQIPSLLNLFLGGNITIETMSILDDLENYTSDWKNNSNIMLLSKDAITIINKLKGFVKYDRKKIETIYNLINQELNLAS